MMALHTFSDLGPRATKTAKAAAAGKVLRPAAKAKKPRKGKRKR